MNPLFVIIPHKTFLVQSSKTFLVRVKFLSMVFHFWLTLNSSSRVIRGGSWNSPGNLCTVSYRSNSNLPSTADYGMDFRVCR